MSETDFQERIRRLARATELARQVLAVPPGASIDVLKRARREALKAYHPDRKPDEESEDGKFRLVELSYRCLRDGEGCEELFQESQTCEHSSESESEAPDNRWGYFLSWRERFFG